MQLPNIRPGQVQIKWSSWVHGSMLDGMRRKLGPESFNRQDPTANQPKVNGKDWTGTWKVRATART